MKAKPLFLVLLLMLVGLVALPATPVLAQEDYEEFEFEEPIAIPDPATDAVTDAAAAPWPVCQWGHWIRSRFPSPPVCTREHIDDIRGPVAPCSFIKIGGRWYHIVSVRRVPGKVILGVRPVYFTN